MADELEIGGVGLTILKEGFEVDATGLTILGAEFKVEAVGLTILGAEFKVEAVGLTILGEPTIKEVGRRVFPLPPSQRKLQSQPDKRKFPLPGEQVLP